MRHNLPSYTCARTCVLAFTLALSACDDVEKAIDCIDDDRPQFSTGAATEPGTWMPTLNVLVSDGGGAFGDGADADTLCRTTRTETYVLVVSDL